jgi:hypothetical protein
MHSRVQCMQVGMWVGGMRMKGRMMVKRRLRTKR